MIAVYILTNITHTVLYIGVTNHLKRRIWEHKNKLVEGFSTKYNTSKLVYYEAHTDVRTAIWREKCLKKWKRDWKNALITQTNPHWQDLYDTL